jgi:hypothetical protein
MRCYICNVILSTKEIIFDEEDKVYPCLSCREVISDTILGYVTDEGEPDDTGDGEPVCQTYPLLEMRK